MSNNRKLQLEFLPNDAEEDEGLGHAGIETYRDEPYAGTARECGQNTRDAAATLPVRISFDMLELKPSDIPALDTLASTIDACLKKAVAAHDQKEIAFFKQAKSVVAADLIKVLRIADFNTTGVKGPPTSGTPFHSLVKGAGVSKKESDTSGGSFGIGKNAVYAISDLQTVFYSTSYVDSRTGASHFLAQGKSILVSHEEAAGSPRRASGYWGLPKFQAIDNKDDVPSWLRRDETGTSVFAIGFRETADWQHRIAYSLLQNFFYAIDSGEMEFTIDGGEIVIGKESLRSDFEDPQICAAAEENDRQSEFALSRSLYECLISGDANEQVVNIPDLGQVRIRVLVAEGLPKKVCIIRNGMVITDNLEAFGEKFARFPMYRDFVALAVPLDNQGRAFIKTLENPRHDGLSAERLPDKARRDHAKKVMRALAKAIRTTIRSYTLTQFDNEVSADEMRKYFEAEATSPPQGGQATQDDPEVLRFDVEKPSQPRPQVPAFGPGNAGGTKQGHQPKHNKGKRRTGQQRGTTGGETGGMREIDLADVRNFLGAQGNPRLRTILFTPAENGEIRITLEASGLQESEKIAIVSASGATVSNGEIRQQVTANARTRIDVELQEAYAGPIELRAVIKPPGGSAVEDQ